MVLISSALVLTGALASVGIMGSAGAASAATSTSNDRVVTVDDVNCKPITDTKGNVVTMTWNKKPYKTGMCFVDINSKVKSVVTNADTKKPLVVAKGATAPKVTGSTSSDSNKVPQEGNVLKEVGDLHKGGAWFFVCQAKGKSNSAKGGDGKTYTSTFWLKTQGLNGNWGWISVTDVAQGNPKVGVKGIQAC